MILRIAKTLSVVVVLGLLSNAQPAMCEGWPLGNLFSSEAKSKKPTTKPAKTTKKEPGVIEKTGTGVKDFFGKTGEALGLKKTAPKKPLYAMPKTPVLQSKQKQEKSLLGSLNPFKSEEPERPYKDVGDWMSKTKRQDP